MGIGCGGGGVDVCGSLCGAASASAGSNGGVEERWAQRNSRTGGTAASAWGYDGTNGAEPGAAWWGRSTDSEDDRYCESPGGLQHGTHRDGECCGIARRSGMGVFLSGRCATLTGGSCGAIS